MYVHKQIDQYLYIWRIYIKIFYKITLFGGSNVKTFYISKYYNQIDSYKIFSFTSNV